MGKLVGLRRPGRPRVRLSDLNICPADDGYSANAARIFAYSASVLLVQLLKIREESEIAAVAFAISYRPAASIEKASICPFV